ncbi:hypothetical protein ACFLZ7_03160 [Nanoarchaeota archaeon]
MKFKPSKILLSFLILILLMQTTSSLGVQQTAGCFRIYGMSGPQLNTCNWDADYSIVSDASNWEYVLSLLDETQPIKYIEFVRQDYYQSTAHRFANVRFSCMGGPTGTCCGDDEIINNGFEQPGDGPWKWTGDISIVTPPVNERKGGARVGQLSYFGSDTSQLPKGYSIPVSISENGTYVFSTWVYSHGAYGPPAAIYLMGKTATDTSFQMIDMVGTGLDFPKNKWILLKKITYVKDGITQLRVRLDNQAAGKVYFDNVNVWGPSLDDGDTYEGDRYICAFNNQYWQLKDAQVSGGAFKITPIANSYDSISNGRKWYSCNPASSIGDLANSFNFTELNSWAYDAPPGAGTVPVGTAGALPSVELTDSDSTIKDMVPVSEFLLGGQVVTQQIISIQNQLGSGQILNITPSEQDGSAFNIITIRGSNFTDGEIIGEDSIIIGGKSTNHSSETANSVGDIGPLDVMIMDGLVEGTYTVTIETVEDTNTHFYDFTEVYTVTSAGASLSTKINEIDEEKFICYDKADYGAIAECCGTDYRYCLNENYNPTTNTQPKTRTAGQTINLIEDYYCANAENCVLQMAFIDDDFPSYQFPIPYSDVDVIPISDWRDYDTLEFDIYFATSNLFNLKILDNDDHTLEEPKVKVLLDVPIVQHSVDGDALEQWHHIIINLSKMSDRKKVGRLLLYADGQALREDAGTKLIEIEGINYTNAVGVDRFFLNAGNQQYCSADMKWRNDLDLDEIACDSTTTTGWTGNQCCGDDQGRFNSDFPNGIETYNDEDAGCWKGKIIRNNSRVLASV